MNNYSVTEKYRDKREPQSFISVKLCILCGTL